MSVGAGTFPAVAFGYGWESTSRCDPAWSLLVAVLRGFGVSPTLTAVSPLWQCWVHSVSLSAGTQRREALSFGEYL